MMGTSHAVSGAAAWVAIATSAQGFPSLGLLQLEPWQVLTGAIVCAGAALLPDADHHNATIAHSVPGVGAAAAGLAGALSGGHRHGMHSLLAVIAVWFVTGWTGALLWKPDWWATAIPIGATLSSAALLAFAFKVLKIVKSWPRAWLLGASTAAALGLFLPAEIGWFQLCVTVGYCVHLLGDFLTVQGINWFWPLKLRAPKFIQLTPVLSRMWGGNGYFSLPLLGTAGSFRETILGTMLALYTLAGLAVTLLTPLLPS